VSAVQRMSSLAKMHLHLLVGDPKAHADPRESREKWAIQEMMESQVYPDPQDPQDHLQRLILG